MYLVPLPPPLHLRSINSIPIPPFTRDTQVRGVSGGERKRVTTGEVLVGNQRVMCMDEISTGLDSAILYSIISFLKQSVSALHSTVLISLLQPPPEVMGLFDDIIVMHDGWVDVVEGNRVSSRWLGGCRAGFVPCCWVLRGACWA